MDTHYSKYLERKYGKELAKGAKFVFVFEEKHGTNMYFIGSIEQLAATSLKILTARFKEGYWYLDPAKYTPEKPSLTKEEIEKMAPGKVKDFALEELSQYERSLKRWKNEMGEYTDIANAVKEKDGAFAFCLLENRGDHEYEKCYLEELTEVK